MIELALVIPFLIIVVLAAFDFSGLFRNYQKLSMISRESANVAFRDCLSQVSNSDIESCVAASHLKISTQLGAALPGVELLISLYELNTSTATVERKAIYPSSGLTDSGRSTYYDATKVQNEVLSLRDGNNRVVISEVYFRETPFWRTGDQQYYESTIY
jgi:Flp pilus assembly protein TadG